MSRTTLILCLLASCLSSLSAAEKIALAPASVPSDWGAYVTDAANLPVEKSAWGTLQWLCNGKLLPGAAQTVGIAQIYPGKTNVLHYHPNCEEVLYVLSGRGVQSFDGRAIELKAGMTIRIPAGTRHNMANQGTEPLVALISFSSGDRRTVFLNEALPGQGPTTAPQSK